MEDENEVKEEKDEGEKTLSVNVSEEVKTKESLR